MSELKTRRIIAKAFTFVRNQLQLKIYNLKINLVSGTTLLMIQVFSRAFGSIVFSGFFGYFSSGKKNNVELLYNRYPQNLWQAILFTLGFSFLLFLPQFSKAQQNLVFSADTKSQTFLLDTIKLTDFKLVTIYKVLGKPSRIERRHCEKTDKPSQHRLEK